MIKSVYVASRLRLSAPSCLNRPKSTRLTPRVLLLGHQPSAACFLSDQSISVWRHSGIRRPQALHTPIRSQIGANSVFLALVVIVVASTTYIWPNSASDKIEGEDLFFGRPSPVSFVGCNMSSTQQALAGRPGTLTEEQEEKLKQLWRLSLKVFGVIQTPAELPESGVPEPATIPVADKSKTHKKNRLSFFRRRDDETTAAESATGSGSVTPSTGNILASIGEDDKHGLAKTFQQALSDMTPEQIREQFWNMVKHDHPDALLLRFLRARKWDVNAALVMTIAALHWRATESKVDADIMFNGEETMDHMEKAGADATARKEGADFMAQMRLGKSFLHGVDKEGRPVCVCRARLHRPGEQSEASLERFTVYTIETARLFLRPPVDTATIVFDMTDFSMANMDYTPVKFMIKCFEANYPESLGTVLVHKAPWIFQGIYKIIKGWLDPVVAAKVHFTNDLGDLAIYLEKSSIIKELGGPRDWTYQYVEPVAGENSTMQDTDARKRLEGERKKLSDQYESLVLDWIGAQAGSNAGGDKPQDDKVLPVEQFRQRKADLARELSQNYWNLDPYVRSRSVYDRTGVLKGAEAEDPNAATQNLA